MNIFLYTTPGCSACGFAKQLCGRAKVDYIEIEPGGVGQIAKWEFQEQFPDIRGFPFIVIKEPGEEDLQFIGVVELAKFFLDKGLVSSKKKEKENEGT